MKVFKLSLIGMIFLFLAGLIILEAQETTSTPEGNSEETEEDDIFSDDELFVPQEEIEDDNLADELNQEKITFSGELNFTLGYGLTRKFLTGEAPITDNLSSSAIDADFLLDIRFLEGIKAFGDLFVRYDGSEEISSLATLVGIKEVFLDTNIGLRVYFRLGKQVVKWGKGYLWNPTDYINLDRKNFLDLDVRREGVYGLKLHVPVGTTFNFYSFLDVQGAANPYDFAYAGKLEFLVSTLEFSFSGWGKAGNLPHFGLDFAGKIFDLDFWGEASFSYGWDRPKLSSSFPITTYEIEDELVPLLVIGLGKSFDFMNVADRITLMGEFFYNHAGYEEHMFEAGSVAQFVTGGYYQFGQYGKYYAALFTTIRKFILSEMTLSLNLLSNLTDPSFILITNWVYNPVNHVNLSFNVIAYFGQENREFTFAGQGLDLAFSLALQY